MTQASRLQNSISAGAAGLICWAAMSKGTSRNRATGRFFVPIIGIFL
jgi:hypothetical protein